VPSQTESQDDSATKEADVSTHPSGLTLPAPSTQVQQLRTEGRAVEKFEQPDRRRGRVNKYNPTKDGVRWFLARGLVWILGGTVFSIVALVATKRWTGLTTDEITNSTAALFTALVSLTGSALGFYFGTKDRRPEN